MKWIKLFESFEKSEWYEPFMIWDEYYEWCLGKGPNGKPTSFSDSEISRIKSILPSGDDFSIVRNGPASTNPEGQLITISRKDRESKGGFFVKKNVNIYQLTIMKFSDDWFTCQVYLRDEKGIFSISNYYKCDQIDGLIRIIKDVINWIEIW